MEEKNQNIEEKKDLTQEEIEEVQGGSGSAVYGVVPNPNFSDSEEFVSEFVSNVGF